MVGVNKMRNSIAGDLKNVRAKGTDEYNFRNTKPAKIKFGPLPSIDHVKTKSSMGIITTQLDTNKMGRAYSSKVYFEN